jgi:hypothetical protein
VRFHRVLIVFLGNWTGKIRLPIDFIMEGENFEKQRQNLEMQRKQREQRFFGVVTMTGHFRGSP